MRCYPDWSAPGRAGHEQFAGWKRLCDEPVALGSVDDRLQFGGLQRCAEQCRIRAAEDCNVLVKIWREILRHLVRVGVRIHRRIVHHAGETAHDVAIRGNIVERGKPSADDDAFAQRIARMRERFSLSRADHRSETGIAQGCRIDPSFRKCRAYGHARHLEKLQRPRIAAVRIEPPAR